MISLSKIIIIVALPVLNFPPVDFRFQKNEKNKLQIFDIIRKKFVDLTPEEWVRQHVVHFLKLEMEVPESVIAVEKQFILNHTKRRFDVLVHHSSTLNAIMVVECKAPEIKLNELTVNQALRYNLELQVPYVFLSNGLQHIFIDLTDTEPKILKSIPKYLDLIKK